MIGNFQNKNLNLENNFEKSLATTQNKTSSLNMTPTTNNNNNVITIANKINGSDFDILVKSYDQNGSLNWTYTYDSGNGARDRALKVLVDNNDNYYVVGSSEDLTSGHDVLIFKLSSSGALQWDEFWNGSGCIAWDGAHRRSDS